MKILIASTPATGHLNPLLAIGRILIAEGHEIAFLTGSASAHRIEGIGAKFHPLPAGADFDLRGLRRGGSRTERPFRRGSNGCASPWSGCSSIPFPLSTRACSRCCEEFPADIIIGDDMFFGVLPMLLGPRSKRPPDRSLRHIVFALAPGGRRAEFPRLAARDHAGSSATNTRRSQREHDSARRSAGGAIA